MSDTKSKHTPGPWIWPGLGPRKIYAPCQHGNRLIATVHVFGYPWTSRAESEANIHLIESAPELLEACAAAKALLEQAGLESSDEYANISFAIAKATGRES